MRRLLTLFLATALFVSVMALPARANWSGNGFWNSNDFWFEELPRAEALDCISSQGPVWQIKVKTKDGTTGSYYIGDAGLHLNFWRENGTYGGKTKGIESGFVTITGSWKVLKINNVTMRLTGPDGAEATYANAGLSDTYSTGNIKARAQHFCG